MKPRNIEKEMKKGMDFAHPSGMAYLCKYHLWMPTPIVIEPKKCHVCAYFEYWNLHKPPKKWYQFWK